MNLKNFYSLNNKDVLILGAAREGISTANFLTKNYPEIRLSFADKNSNKPEIEAALSKNNLKAEHIFNGEDYLDSLDSTLYSDLALVFRSPGISLHNEKIQNAKKNGIIFSSQTELFLSTCPGKVIGITGTKGKSTTSTILFQILKEAKQKVKLIGNIGIPAIDLLEEAEEDDFFVFELSSYQLDGIKISPKYAVILDIFSDHLDYHADNGKNGQENYVKAKKNIYLNQNQDSVVFYNSYNPFLNNIEKETKAFKIDYSKFEIEIPEASNLKSKAEVTNFKIAACVANHLGIKPEQIKKAALDFKPLEHRLEFITTKNKISFYNDSLATTPEALLNAIDSLSRNLETLICGGNDRGIDYTKLGEPLAQSKIKNIILLDNKSLNTKAGEKIMLEVKKHKNDKNFFSAGSMKEAIELAFRHTKEDKSCLLSPAASSFGMFRDYRDRGEQFKNEIKNFGEA